MFKKTVVTMALVMMAANAFAGVEVRSEARDEKRIESEADKAGLETAKKAGISDARLADSVGELVRESAVQDQKDHTAKAKQLADALSSIKDSSRVVGGKTIRASDVIASLGAKVRALRTSGKMTVERAKNALFETQFVALAFRNAKDPSSKGAQVAVKEASLASQIIDPSWDGKAATSHINLDKDVARTMQSEHAESDVATNEVFKKDFKEDATKRLDDDIHCE